MFTNYKDAIIIDIRGVIASASLKHVNEPGQLTGDAIYPRRYRLGLIEAAPSSLACL